MISFTRITSRCGLTLIEITVAIAIMVVLFAWILGPLMLGFDLFGRGAGKAVLKQDAVVTADTLRKDIREAAFVYLTGVYNVDDDKLTIGSTWTAVKFIPERTCTMRSFSFRICCSADISNDTAVLEGYVCSGTTTPATFESTAGEIKYGDINTVWEEQNFNLQSSYQVTQGIPVWLVLKQSQVPAGGNILLDGGLIGEMITAHSDDGSVWTAVGDQAVWHGVYNEDGTYSIRGQKLNLKMPAKDAQTVGINTGDPLTPLKIVDGELWQYYTQYDNEKKLCRLIKEIPGGLNYLTGEPSAVTSFIMDNNGLVTVDLLLKSDKDSGKEERIRLAIKSRPLSK
ncbi:MAG: prepilin-type N-terminal cleavage/methylation domain-containing protein [bacterium]|nr:prepilin-type N-terminal cleavage/methylation domain-containing protein [bacterium]